MSTARRAIDDGVRRRLRIESKATFADTIAWFGVYVGPRSKMSKHVKQQEEEWCARRWLVAMVSDDRFRLPFTVELNDELATQNQRLPDLVVRWDDDEVLGVEITQAGSGSYQSYLTRSAKSSEAPEVFAQGGRLDRFRDTIVGDIERAIEEKSRKALEGGYASVSKCDLLVYVNSEGDLARVRGPLEDWESSILAVLRQRRRPEGAFRQIHLIWGETVFLDVLGNTPASIDLSTNYTNDWWAWLRAQAGHLRARRFDDIDYDNLAEELEGLGRSDKRALTSHLRNLLVHLLKWRFQPEKRTPSWKMSIQNARDEIEEALAESPSFEPALDELAVKQYPKAREDAADEMDVDADALPQVCPFELDQILDRKFFPDANP